MFAEELRLPGGTGPDESHHPRVEAEPASTFGEGIEHLAQQLAAFVAFGHGTSYFLAILAIALPLPKASIGTLALNAAEWLRRGPPLPYLAPVVSGSIFAQPSS